MNLKQLIRETLENKDCCTAAKPTKAPILNESIAPREILSEGLKYHIDNNTPLTEHVYRAGSSNYFNLWAEARTLYTRGILDFSGDDLAILTETHLGEFGIYKGKKVPLDFIFEEEIEEINLASVGVDIAIEKLKTKFKELGFSSFKDAVEYIKNGSLDDWYELRNELGILEENKKKNPPIGKPKRGGAKKFYVYVKDKGKIKKVSFGDTSGLSAKINNSKARAAFSKRHDCPNKKDRTKASYWSCRLPRYAKLLGLKSNFSGFW
jgi:hypothetical protein